MMNHVSNYKLTYLSMMDVFSVLMLMIFDNFYKFYDVQTSNIYCDDVDDRKKK